MSEVQDPIYAAQWAAQVREFLVRHRLSVTNYALVEQALTHSSYAFENHLPHDNERLEFLGDAVLGLLVSEYLYEEHPRAREGVLSKQKASLVSRNVLGQRALTMGLGSLVLLGRGEELNGGRDRASLLGSALEALVGALYLNLGLDGVRPFVVREIFEPGRALSATDEFGDYKSQLQELVQKHYQTVPEYELIAETGPDHNKYFEVQVRVAGEIRGRGSGSRKKTAENRAAMQAYWALRELLGESQA
ncbi:MAG: ribonuclease III [Candidatus Sumerlaeaceae bacterium]|nr:ribonuclease III [Candidatus Sumerlaeaceae bacterium]